MPVQIVYNLNWVYYRKLLHKILIHKYFNTNNKKPILRWVFKNNLNKTYFCLFTASIILSILKRFTVSNGNC